MLRFRGYLNAIFSRRSRIQPLCNEMRIFPRLQLPDTVLHFEYDMNNDHRGIALVFNHEHFIDQKQRVGAHHDTAHLKKTLENLAFDVNIFNDLRSGEIIEELKKGD